MAIIEYMMNGGQWSRGVECADHPQAIRLAMEATLKTSPAYVKVRAVDSKTKQLVDMMTRLEM
jgi:hypothetical protein